MAKYLSLRRLDVLCSVIFLLVKVTTADKKFNGNDMKTADQPQKTNKMSFWNGDKSAGGNQCSGNYCPTIFHKINENKKDGEKIEERECKGTCPCGDLLDDFTCIDWRDFRNLGWQGYKGPAIPGYNDRELTGVPDLEECKRICLNSDGLETRSMEFAGANSNRNGWCSCSSKAPGDKGVSIVYEDGMTFCLRKCEPMSKPVKKPTAKGVYLGCFKAGGGYDKQQPICGTTTGPHIPLPPRPLPRDIYEQQYNFQDNSRNRCVARCFDQGYKFAGLQFNRCFCGNSYGTYGRVNENYCNVSCPIGYNGILDWDTKVNKTKGSWKYDWTDHASDKCGGWSEHRGDNVKNSVYWTTLEDPFYQPLMFFNSGGRQGPPAASVAGRVRRSLGGLMAVLVFCYALVRCRF